MLIEFPAVPHTLPEHYQQTYSRSEIKYTVCVNRPPLWSSVQTYWLQSLSSRVRFPALPDFLSSSRSGTGSTQPL
jgi:hypothetical protein